MKCFNCNADMRLDKGPYKYEESGLSGVYLMNFKHYKCDKCGDESIEIPRIWFLHLAIGLNLLKKRTALNGAEISFLRRELNMSLKEFADELKVHYTTVSKWENDKKSPQPISDQAIRLLFWKNIQKMLADRLDVLEESIRRMKIVTSVKQKTEVDMSRLNMLTQPAFIQSHEESMQSCQ